MENAGNITYTLFDAIPLLEIAQSEESESNSDSLSIYFDMIDE